MTTPTQIQKYVITDKLPSSTNGLEKYLAKQHQLNRRVELRILNRTIKPDSREFKRFKRELSLLANLDHPGIIKILDVGTYDNRLFYITTFRRAKSIEELLQKTESVFSVKEALKMALTIADALKHMHRNKILHRNISTSNIFYDLKNLRFYIGGFSTIKLIKEENLDKSQWSDSRTDFFAPEQYKNETLDERTDIYLLGSVLYKVLTFQPLNSTNTEDTNTFDLPSKFNAKISDSLDKIITKSLKESPDERFQTISELIIELEEIND